MSGVYSNPSLVQVRTFFSSLAMTILFFAPFGSFFIFLVLRASVEAGLSCFGISVLGFAFQGYKTPAYPGSECLAQILFLCLTKSMRRFLGGSFSWAGSFEPESMNVFLPAFQNLVGGGIERSH